MSYFELKHNAETASIVHSPGVAFVDYDQCMILHLLALAVGKVRDH